MSKDGPRAERVDIPASLNHRVIQVMAGGLVVLRDILLSLKTQIGFQFNSIITSNMSLD